MQPAKTAGAVHVLLVEDHAPIRQAIASEFEPDPEFEIVGQAGSLAEARGLLASADVAILDLGLPDGSGIDLIPELRAANPQALAVVLSASHDPTLQAQAVELGAAAVLDKARHLGQVAQAVRRVLSGERLMPAQHGP
jgi:DNA-binding NarL/FixJ family response regulator